ncbi:uncharacterized protein LOC144101349 isoform X2 [Amblyomma americanum]
MWKLAGVARGSQDEDFPGLKLRRPKKAAAPVSRQAHALLDVNGNGGGLGQQHSELLLCLRHVGVSRDYRPVYSGACRRGSGGCLGHCRMGNVSRWHNEKLPPQVTSAAISMRQQSRRLEEVASVSRQAHALLDADGNGGGLGQQHRELLPCLRHVGVSRGTVLLPNSAVTTSGCVRGKGRLQHYSGRRAEAELPPVPHIRPMCKKRECPSDRVLRSSGHIARKAPHCQQGGHVQLCQRVVRVQQGRSVVHRPVRGGHQGVGGAAGHHVLCLEEELLHCCCIPVPAAAPVSHQAHALLDVNGNGGGLGQQHSELLLCLRHVGVSRDYHPVYSGACRRGSGGCLGPRVSVVAMGDRVLQWNQPCKKCGASWKEAASVSRQAHALLDADGNEGGLGQQHRELLPCLRHVGVSRGAVLLPNSAVTTSGCVRGKGRLQQYSGRRAEAELPPVPHIRPMCKKRECPSDRVLRSSGHIARKAPHCQQGGHVQLCQRVVRVQQGRSVVHRPVRGGHQGVGGAAGHHVLCLEEELLHCCCIPVPAAAPVSRQAHALLDIGAIGGGLEQQPSQLLAAMPSSRGCEPRRRRTSQPPRLLRGLRAEEMRVPQCRFSAVSVLKHPQSEAAAVDAHRGPGGSTQGTEPAPPLSAPPQGSFAQGIQDGVYPTATQLLPATTSTNGAASCSTSNGHGDATASLPSTRTRAPSKNTPAADISSRRFTHLRGKIIGTAAMERDEEWQRVLDKMFFEELRDELDQCNLEGSRRAGH